MSDNWVVQNLENALEVWNEKLAEIWTIITQSPETFRGGQIWSVITNIHGAIQAIGYALLVLFFVVGVMKTCGSFAELKKPEHAIKIFIRFVLAKAVVTYGLELMIAFLSIICCSLPRRHQCSLRKLSVMVTSKRLGVTNTR